MLTEKSCFSLIFLSVWVLLNNLQKSYRGTEAKHTITEEFGVAQWQQRRKYWRYDINSHF